MAFWANSTANSAHLAAHFCPALVCSQKASHHKNSISSIFLESPHQVHYGPSMMSKGKTPGKDPPELALQGSEGFFHVKYLGKTPQTPVNPFGGSFPGVFPWDIIGGP